MISYDTHPLEVYAAEFVIDNGQLGFIATDSQRNLRCAFWRVRLFFSMIARVCVCLSIVGIINFVNSKYFDFDDNLEIYMKSMN